MITALDDRFWVKRFHLRKIRLTLLFINFMEFVKERDTFIKNLKGGKLPQ